jgi:hypothetical protein
MQASNLYFGYWFIAMHLLTNEKTTYPVLSLQVAFFRVGTAGLFTYVHELTRRCGFGSNQRPSRLVSRDALNQLSAQLKN